MVINNGDPVGYPTLESTTCDSRGILKLNQSLVINKSGLDELYKVDKGAPFATGLYAQVRRCRSLRQTSSQKSQQYYAAKFSPRKRPGHSQNEDCVESLHEIALLCQLKNPYIISFKDAFILDHFIVTIMEFAPGGDLQSVIDADLVLLEKDASRYVYQLLEALKYLHERHIAHLDIKPQNLLLMGEFPSCDIKLCDFEISRVIKPGMEIREILGTPDYVAPEILLYEPLSTFCDMWSVGILTYVLLTGFSPFGGDTDQETFRNIINEPIDFPDELFEDVSPEAINFIEKLTVKNSRIRPSATEIELHEWVRSYLPPALIVSCEKEPSPQPAPKEPSVPPQSPVLGDRPKKRSPRKASAMSGCSTASASPSGRRISARSILRACKSAYDLNKMGGKTKSREALIEKMRIATGEPSGGPWKLRKNLSKSREQLWESKILLSKSCEKINNNFPGSSRWASVANFPSLDMNTMKSATSQESVISVISTCTNIGQQQQQFDMSDWQQQQQDEGLPYSVSMPTTPPVPNFDLSQNNGYHESSPPILTNNYCGLQAKMNAGGEYSGYPSLSSSSTSLSDAQYMTPSQANNAAIEEAQKSVAELIMTFGGRVSKKLDLKNKFEPILEVDGSEEQPMSLGDCSDNNSTSGVSSIVPTCNKDLKNNEQHGKQLDSNSTLINTALLNNGKSLLIPTIATKMDTGQQGESSSANSSRRNSKTTQQIQDEMKASERRYNNRPNDNSNSTGSSRRGSASPPKTADGTALKGILKKPKQPDPVMTLCNKSFEQQFPNPNSTRRGSVPGNCYRLYEQHTISSSAKAPRRSILKNGSSNVSTCSDNSKQLKSSSVQATKGTSDRSTSRSPENSSTGKQSPAKDDGPSHDGKNENIPQPPSSSTMTTESLALIQNNQSRPASVLLTSNADNKISTTTESLRKGRSPNDFNSFVIPTCEKEKDEQEVTAQHSQKSRQQSRKRHEQTTLETNRFMMPQQNSNLQQLQPEGILSSSQAPPMSTGDGTEPAAVAIKVFPPDPIIIPKSSVLLLNTASKAPDSPNTEDNNSPPIHPEFKEYMKRNAVHTSAASSITINRHATQRTQEGVRSQWRTGTGCTGSVERAKERFESVRSKLRRGSVPDF